MSIHDIKLARNQGQPWEIEEMEFQKELLREVDEIVRENSIWNETGYELPFNAVCADDQKRLVAIMLKQSKLWGEEFEAIHEGAGIQKVEDSFMNVLSDYTTHGAIYFTDVLIDCMTAYYQPRIQRLLNERVLAMEVREYEEHGFYASQDKETGETVWKRGVL